MKMRSSSRTDTEKVAKEFVRGLPKHAGKTAMIIGLYGDLGSGKTTFTQDVAHALGISGDITSPTYVIEKKYAIAHPAFSQLVHIDAYRLASGKELLALDWPALLADPKNLILIEWPERVADILPEHRTISFSFVSEHERDIDM